MIVSWLVGKDGICDICLCVGERWDKWKGAWRNGLSLSVKDELFWLFCSLNVRFRSLDGFVFEFVENRLNNFVVESE